MADMHSYVAPGIGFMQGFDEVLADRHVPGAHMHLRYSYDIPIFLGEDILSVTTTTVSFRIQTNFLLQGGVESIVGSGVLD